MQAIDPGRLRHRVQVQTRAATTDDMGQAAEQWATVLTVWAEALPLRGREFFAAAQVQQEHSVKFTMRWRPELKPTARIVWRGQVYDITGVTDLGGRGAWAEVMALQGVKDGR
jgi:SPP1 family predicted phage head-tail adaptor